MVHFVPRSCNAVCHSKTAPNHGSGDLMLRDAKVDYMAWATAGAPRVSLLDSGVSNSLRGLDVDLGTVIEAEQPLFGDAGVRDALARRYGVPEDEVFATLGTSMALFLGCAAVLGPDAGARGGAARRGVAGGRGVPRFSPRVRGDGPTAGRERDHGGEPDQSLRVGRAPGGVDPLRASGRSLTLMERRLSRTLFRHFQIHDEEI